MAGSLKVVHQELLDRATKLEEPLPPWPADTPAPPCALALVRTPAEDLAAAAKKMRQVLGYAQTGWKTLAAALRNAAFAYELADEEMAAALANETPVPQAVVPRLADGEFGPPMLGDRPVLTDHHPMPVEFETVEQAALQLEQGDQGASLTRFAREWEKYESALRNATNRFDRFREWEGDDIIGACKKVEDIFALQSDWLESTALLCRQLAQRADAIVRAHKVAVDKHVPGGDFKADGIIQFKYKTFVELDAFMQAHWNDQFRQRWFKTFYTGVTKDSKEILDAYQAAVASSGPLQPSSPPNVGKAEDVVPKPMPPKPFVPTPDDYWNWEEEERKRKEKEEMDKKHEKNLRPPPRPPDPEPEPTPVPTPGGGGSDMPMMPTMPTMPMMPTPSTPQPDPVLADALKDLKGQGAPKLPQGGGVKPASFGGAGAPGTPLQSWGDDGASAKAAAAGPAGPGRGVPGVGGTPGAMGGGMGGAPAAGGDKGGKGKRVQGNDEAMYTEDRAWTEGVIGRRSPAKEVPKQ